MNNNVTHNIFFLTVQSPDHNSNIINHNFPCYLWMSVDDEVLQMIKKNKLIIDICESSYFEIN